MKMRMKNLILITTTILMQICISNIWVCNKNNKNKTKILKLISKLHLMVLKWMIKRIGRLRLLIGKVVSHRKRMKKMMIRLRGLNRMMKKSKKMSKRNLKMSKNRKSLKSLFSNHKSQLSNHKKSKNHRKNVNKKKGLHLKNKVFLLFGF